MSGIDAMNEDDPPLTPRGDDPKPSGEKVVCPECTTLQHVNGDGTLRRHNINQQRAGNRPCPRGGKPPGPMPTDHDIAMQAARVRLLELAAEDAQKASFAASDRYGEAARELDKMLDNRALDAERFAATGVVTP